MGSWSFSVSCQGASTSSQLTFHYPVLSPKLLYIAASVQEPVAFLTESLWLLSGKRMIQRARLGGGDPVRRDGC